MKKILLPITVLGQLFCVLYSANADQLPTNSQTKKTAFVGAPSLHLGDGYVSYDHMSTGETALDLSRTTVRYSTLSNDINLGRQTSRDDLASNLNIDVSASGGWGLFSAKASSAYFKYTENTQYSENFTFSERYFTNASLDISQLPGDVGALTSVAAKMYHNENDSISFANRYGDAFISQLPMGAYLIVNIQINFSSALHKEKFNASAGGGFGSIFNVSTSIQRAVSSSHAQGNIEISAFQLGGNPAELPKIFAKNASGGFYVTSCNLSALVDCQKAIDGVIDYAQNNFNKQINPDISRNDKDHLVVVGAPELKYYQNIFGLRPPASLDPSVVMSRFDLADQYNDLKKKKEFFDHFLLSPAAAYFTPEAHILINEMSNTLNWNLSLFNTLGAMNCYVPGKESTCATILSNFNQYKKPMDNSVIDYYMNTTYLSPQSGCYRYPIGIPPKPGEAAPFASYCHPRKAWIPGVSTYTVSTDNKKITVTEDFIEPDNGYHYSASGILETLNDSFADYVGVMTWINLSRGGSTTYHVTLMRIKNNI